MNGNSVPIPREVLEAPFPPELIKTRPGSFGASLSYLEGHTVIHRLNEAFDGNWSFKIISHQVLDEEVLVLGKLKSETVTKMAFGSSKITRSDRTGQAVSIGDDLKAAATDALKKAATLMGVGLSLYGGQPVTDSQGDRPFEEDLRDPKPGTRNGGGKPSPQGNGGNGNGQTNGRITNRQISAIFAIARERKMTNQDVRDLAKEIFGKNVDYLTKQEASALIEQLLAH